MAGRTWTSEEYDYIKKGHSSGMSVREISLKINRSEVAVGHKLRELGFSSTGSKKAEKFSTKEKQDIEEASYDFENSLLKAELKEMKQKVC